MQWLTLHLQVQRVQVQILVREQKPHTPLARSRNKKQNQYCNKFSTDFLTNGPCQKNLLKKKKEVNWTQIFRKDIISGLSIVLRGGHLAG